MMGNAMKSPSLRDVDLTTATKGLIDDHIKAALVSGHPYRVSITRANVGRWSMTRLWRSWMGSVAEHMARAGAEMPLYPGSKRTRPYNEGDAHEAFTMLLLGCDDQGNRYSWAKGKSGANGKPVAPKSKRVHAMTKMEHWMIERGIKYMNPAERNEYRDALNEQEQ